MVDTSTPSPKNNFPTKKSQEQLKHQLHAVESALGKNFLSEEKTEEALRSSLDALKANHPEEYTEYLTALRLGTHHIDMTNESNVVDYSSEEYQEICDAISGKNSLSDVLKTKISSDLNFKTYPSPVIFFPEIYERIYVKKEVPQLWKLPTSTRPSAIKIDFADISYIVKLRESTPEVGISHTAGKLGMGPQQFTSLKDHLTEEFIEGTPLLKLDEKMCTPEYMKTLGVGFGQALKKLHDNNILYNEQLLTDDFGKSHIIIDKKGKVRFIDFGASIDLSHFPDFSEEEVHSLMRTDTFASFVLSNLNFMEKGPEKEKAIASALTLYREKILSNYKTKEDLIQAKDYQLLREGISFLQHRLPNVFSFMKGVDEVIHF